MAPLLPDDPRLPRRSHRATAALIAGFFLAAVVLVIGHADRLGDPDPAFGSDPGDPLAPAVAPRSVEGSDPGLAVAPAADPAIVGVVLAEQEPDAPVETVRVHLVAPVAWKQALAPGSIFQFQVDQTGRRHEGRVLGLDDSASPDPATVRVVGRLDGEAAALQPGMRGSVRLAAVAPFPHR